MVPAGTLADEATLTEDAPVTSEVTDDSLEGDNTDVSDSVEIEGDSEAVADEGTVTEEETDSIVDVDVPEEDIPSSLSEVSAQSTVASTETVTVYRLYNPNTGEHFYTQSPTERSSLVSAGWQYEGVGWTAPAFSSTLVYRLYNSYVAGGDHHYTSSTVERDSLVKVGWKWESAVTNGWYSAASTDYGAVKVYRLYNPNADTGTHHYTTSAVERLKLASDGWSYEGVAWYALDTTQQPAWTVAGWVQGSDGSWYYGLSDGTFAASQWLEIDGTRYWFDSNGRRASGLVDANGMLYYLNSSGVVQTGWVTLNGYTYYFDPSNGGALKTSSWLSLNGNTYYLTSAGNRATGLTKIGSTTYYFSSSGVLQKSGMTLVGNSWYYFSPSTGAMQTGWININGTYYDFGSDGRYVPQHSLNIAWAGQPNNYYCGPTSGYMVLRNVGAWTSASGASLTIYNVAQYMETDRYGYTSFQDRKFMQGMNNWLGKTVYTSVHTPSYSTVRNAIINSFRNGYATVLDTQERRGGPHYNGHNNGTFGHLIVVDSYNQDTDAVYLVDPGAGTVWSGASQKFWYSSLTTFVTTYLQTEVYGDGIEHIGVHYAQ